ncbi:MAG: DUF952 domain-containing protein [Rhodospirillales bacterium]|jgi:uncharacterized protein (DUF952 family)|nr:DUF952 domain-containing protein [Rhodospirillales bacterium]
MNARRIYHLCRQADWQAAAAKGSYDGSSQDRADGFLHFSTSEQVEDSAARHRAGEPDLLLLVADATLLGDALRWEASSSGQTYPHLYGPLPLSAVLEVVALALGPDGTHEFPLLSD